MLIDLGISRLKSEKEALDREVRSDKIELSALEDKLKTKKKKIEDDGNVLASKESVIKEYDTIISESLKTYDKVNTHNIYLVSINIDSFKCEFLNKSSQQRKQ